MRKLTHEEFENKLYQKYGDSEYEILSQYINTRTKIEVRHKCGFKFNITPDSLYQNGACKECSKKKLHNLFKKDEEDFLLEVKKKHGEKFQILSDYINCKTKIKVKHSCGNEFEILPNHLLNTNGDNCKGCGGKGIKKNQEIFVNNAYKQVGNEYLILGDYINANTYIKIKHSLCNTVYEVKPNSFLQGHRCPKCANNIVKVKITLNENEFNKRLNDVHQGEYINLENYVNSTTKIKFKHLKCKHVWKVNPKQILRGYGCPACNESKGEKRVRKWLCENDFLYESQKGFEGLIGLGGGGLSYDFYLSKENMLIEYQGEYHDGTVSYQTDKDYEKQIEHDGRKKEYAKLHNINLLEIWYWDFDNIEYILDKYIKQTKIIC